MQPATLPRLKIAITDACIFIDLFEVELIAVFFNLDIEIHTTIPVFNELYSEQQSILHAYESVDKLIVHNLQEDDFMEIYSENYPKSLSISDKSVLHLAKKISAFVLSSDKVMRNTAKSMAIEYHGMIWIFDQLVEKKLLRKKEARYKLQELIAKNLLFRNNRQLVIEIEKRLKA